jgi:hypothetical protein
MQILCLPFLILLSLSVPSFASTLEVFAEAQNVQTGGSKVTLAWEGNEETTRKRLFAIFQGQGVQQVLPFTVDFVNPKDSIKGHYEGSVWVEELSAESGLLEDTLYRVEFHENDVEPDSRRGVDFSILIEKATKGLPRTEIFHFNAFYSAHKVRKVDLNEILFRAPGRLVTERSAGRESSIQIFDTASTPVLAILNRRTFSRTEYNSRALASARTHRSFPQPESKVSVEWTLTKDSKLQRVQMQTEDFHIPVNLLHSPASEAALLHSETLVTPLYEGVIPESDAKVMLASYELKLPHAQPERRYVWILRDSSSFLVAPLFPGKLKSMLSASSIVFDPASGRYRNLRMDLQSEAFSAPRLEAKSFPLTIKRWQSRVDHSLPNHVFATQLSLSRSRRKKSVPLSRLSEHNWMNKESYECFFAAGSTRFQICLRDLGELEEGFEQEVLFRDTLLGSTQVLSADVKSIEEKDSVKRLTFDFSENMSPWLSPLHLIRFVGPNPLAKLQLVVELRPKLRSATLQWEALDLVAESQKLHFIHGQLGESQKLCQQGLLKP